MDCALACCASSTGPIPAIRKRKLAISQIFFPFMALGGRLKNGARLEKLCDLASPYIKITSTCHAIYGQT